MTPPYSPLLERRKPRPLLLLFLLLLSIPPLPAHAQSATEDPEAPQPVIEQATEVLQQPASQEARDLAAEVRAGEQSDSRIASAVRSEEHTSALQSLMRISYAVFCLTKNTPKTRPT